VKRDVPLEKIVLQEAVLVLARHRVKNFFERLIHCAGCVVETVIQLIKDAVEDGMPPAAKYKRKPVQRKQHY
jgi:hypothetical protein